MPLLSRCITDAIQPQIIAMGLFEPLTSQLKRQLFGVTVANILELPFNWASGLGNKRRTLLDKTIDILRVANLNN
jgi:hypothetical protein